MKRKIATPAKAGAQYLKTTSLDSDLRRNDGIGILAATLAAALFLCSSPAAASPAASSGEAVLPSLSSGPVTLDEVVAKMRLLDDALDSLTARLEQTLLWKNSGYYQSVEARLSFSKPELFRIDQSSPEAQATVSDGKFLWVWARSRNQVIKTGLKQWKSSEPLARSLTDLGHYSDLLDRYRVRLATVTEPDAVGNRVVSIVLTPKKVSAKVPDFSLTLWFPSRHLFPYDTEFAAGDILIRSHFAHVRFNPDLPKDRFKFTPPPGADVLDNPGLPKVP